ncbi:hypothetical protein E2C01_102056 [Portunus trituberculatus]|uniref:Uncharacterized protein n=1 Tax=Portunus trituberculatus TaxID=210409 RepID=A0A5B7KC60_PORTR|nr:hypothetical protein [Portunus trituberculatus]
MTDGRVREEEVKEGWEAERGRGRGGGGRGGREAAADGVLGQPRQNGAYDWKLPALPFPGSSPAASSCLIFRPHSDCPESRFLR